MAWLATMFGGVKYAMSGPSKPAAATNTPPINASSTDEADFIKCVNSIWTLKDWPANRRIGSSSTSRTRSTKRLKWKRRLCGLTDAVYVYQLWKMGWFNDSDKRIEYYLKPEFSIRGINDSPSTSLLHVIFAAFNDWDYAAKDLIFTYFEMVPLRCRYFNSTALF